MEQFSYLMILLDIIDIYSQTSLGLILLSLVAISFIQVSVLCYFITKYLYYDIFKKENKTL